MMTELEIEDLLIGSMDFEVPVVREPYNHGNMVILDEPEVESFTGTGIADRLVYRIGESVELEIEELLLEAMGNVKPVIRDPVNAGGSYEIPIGAKLGLPGDTLRILDFEENAKTHIVSIVNGLIRSWTIHDDGSLPITEQTHEIIIQDGLIKEWNIAIGGIRTTKNHTVEVLKGLLQSWTVV